MSRQVNPSADPVYYAMQDSPLGKLLLTAKGRALTGLHMLDPGGGPEPGSDWERADAPFQAVRRQLDAYFEGEHLAFDLPLAAQGTPFQQRVWSELRKIPYGQTISYAELARRIGRPTAARAVGAANARNPIPIIVPCHRVIAADGSLGGYGGGIHRKKKLLQLEASHEGLFAVRAEPE